MTDNNIERYNYENSLSLEIFKKFYNNIDIKKGGFNKKTKIIVSLYAILFLLEIYFFMIKSIMGSIITLFFIILLLLITYVVVKKINDIDKVNNYYSYLVKLLEDKKINNSNIVSSLIDEGLYCKNRKSYIKNDFIDILINSYVKLQSLYAIILGSTVLINNSSDLGIYVVIFTALYVVLIMLDLLIEDLKKNKSKVKDLYSMSDCFDLYIEYLYKYKTELSIEESKKLKIQQEKCQ